MLSQQFDYFLGFHRQLILWGKGGLLQVDIYDYPGDLTKVRVIYIFNFVLVKKFREKTHDWDVEGVQTIFGKFQKNLDEICWA